MTNIVKRQGGICRSTIMFLEVKIYEDINFFKKREVTYVTWICVSRNFWWLNLNQRKWWDSLNKWSTRLMDVLVENTKREDSWLSFILEESHIVCWCLCYFLCFHCYVGYGIWGVVLYGMSMPKLDVGGGTLLPRFLLFGDAWFANGRKEGAWWVEEINTWWGGKLNTLVFSLNFNFSIRIVCVRSFLGRMPEV
jgi:hypothetical protein